MNAPPVYSLVDLARRDAHLLSRGAFLYALFTEESVIVICSVHEDQAREMARVQSREAVLDVMQRAEEVRSSSATQRLRVLEHLLGEYQLLPYFRVEHPTPRCPVGRLLARPTLPHDHYIQPHLHPDPVPGDDLKRYVLLARPTYKGAVYGAFVESYDTEAELQRALRYWEQIFEGDKDTATLFGIFDLDEAKLYPYRYEIGPVFVAGATEPFVERLYPAYFRTFYGAPTAEWPDPDWSLLATTIREESKQAEGRDAAVNEEIYEQHPPFVFPDEDDLPF